MCHRLCVLARVLFECSIVQHGATPLYAAASKGHLKVVQYLFKSCNADPHQPDKVWVDIR